MTSTPYRFLPHALLLILLGASCALYLPGLAGDFLFDDFINIVNNRDSHLAAFSWAELSKVLHSGIASEITRPLSMLTFGINYYLTGMDPFYFKLTNVVIHLLITAGIYHLTLLLLRLGPPTHGQTSPKPEFIALAITACWALHPLNVSTVLYVVQRMNQLSVLVSVYTLIFYCSFRIRGACTRPQALGAFMAMLVFLLVGVLCKENAALLPLYILVIEMFLLNFRADSPNQGLFLKLVMICLLAIPAVLALFLLAVSPTALLGDYSVRSFTLFERLLTQARALWTYTGWLLVPDTRNLVFYYDNYPLSKSLLNPISTLFGMLGIGGAAVFCWTQRKRLPYLCFGIAFFFAGHALESSVVALELVFEHRNYLPGFGLLFGCIYTLLNLPSNVLNPRLARGFVGIFVVFIALGTNAEAKKWSNTYSHMVSIAAYNPDSYRTNYSLGYMYLNLASRTAHNAELFSIASHFYRLASMLDEKAVNAHVGVILADSQNGQPIDPVVVAELERRLRENPLASQAFVEASMLTECWYGGFCKFDKTTLIGLFNAIAHNAVTDATIKQGILDQFGTAIAYVYRNKEDGRALLYLAKQQRDDVTVVDLKLIQLELELQNVEQARRLLTEARQKPLSSAFEKALEELDRQLDALPSASD